jgi:hypothetical protein
MNIGCSSESFARSIESGDLTQLEWLDVCANELEVDGVAFAARHFPRIDPEYLAQLKKACTDLGLTIAAVTASDTLWSAASGPLDLAATLGAPVAIAPAPPADDDAGAWGTFAENVKRATRLAKERNVTLAVRNAVGTHCASAADLRRLAKDADSAWLRFAPSLAELDDADARALLPKAVIAVHAIAGLEGFAGPEDPEAAALIARLARFRAFTLVDAPAGTVSNAATHPYHDALARFAALRARALATAAAPAMTHPS